MYIQFCGDNQINQVWGLIHACSYSRVNIMQHVYLSYILSKAFNINTMSEYNWQSKTSYCMKSKCTLWYCIISLQYLFVRLNFAPVLCFLFLVLVGVQTNHLRPHSTLVHEQCVWKSIFYQPLKQRLLKVLLLQAIAGDLYIM